MRGGLLECWQKQMALITEGKLSHSAVVLHAVLLDSWRALGRKPDFDMTNEKLQKAAGFGSHVSLDRAKRELIAAGLIRVESSKKRFGSKYTMLPGNW